MNEKYITDACNWFIKMECNQNCYFVGRCMLILASHIALDAAESYWPDVPTLTTDRADASSVKSQLCISHEQFNHRAQVSSVSESSTKPTTMVSSENVDSWVTLAIQRTNTAEPSSVATHVLSTGQKKRVCVLSVFFLFC